MSYKLAVLRDNPVAFFPLNGTSVLRTYQNILQEYDTYQDWLNTESTYGDDPITYTIEDISYNSNHGGFTLGKPLFADVLPLVTNSTYDTSIQGCRINDSSRIEIGNRQNNYKMFYKGTEKLAFSIEFWVSFVENPILNQTLIAVNDGSETIASITVHNDRLRFTIFGSDYSTGQPIVFAAEKQIKSWDSQMHIYAYYENGTINIASNSEYGKSAVAPDFFNFSKSISDATKFMYSVGPSTDIDYDNVFVINDIAFYDHILSENAIKNHMVWGNDDSKPQNFAQQSDAHFFDIKELPSMVEFERLFAKPVDYQEGRYDNLIADGMGITLLQGSTFTASQGSWTYLIQSSAMQKIAGVKFSWDSAMTGDEAYSTEDYVIVEASSDAGATWKIVENGYPAFYFNDNQTVSYPDILVRIRISTSNISGRFIPRMDNFKVTVYKDLSIYSDTGEYLLSPIKGSFTGDTYAVRDKYYNIMSRTKNFGIKLTPSQSMKSSAAIYPQKQTSGYKTIEFWYRYNELNSNNIQAILSLEGAQPYIYFDPSDGVVYQSNFDEVYVNGSPLNSVKSLVDGESYHFVCTFTDLHNNTIYFNWNGQDDQYLETDLGFITIYSNQLTHNQAVARYLSYITSAVSVIDSSSNIIGTMQEYAGGQPILSYQTPIS
jgi:hypothetical protein